VRAAPFLCWRGPPSALYLLACKALLVTRCLDHLEYLPRISMTPEDSVAHDVPEVCIQIVEDIPGMGDHKPALLPVNDMDILVDQLGDSVADKGYILEVNPALRFIEHHKIRFLDHQLEDFAPFDLTPGESEVDRPVEELIHVQVLGVLGYPVQISS